MALVTQVLLTDGNRNRTAWLSGNVQVGDPVTLLDGSAWQILEKLAQVDETEMPRGWTIGS